MTAKERLVEIINKHQWRVINFVIDHEEDKNSYDYNGKLADEILKEFVRIEDVEVCDECDGLGSQTDDDGVMLDDCQKCNGTGIVVNEENPNGR